VIGDAMREIALIHIAASVGLGRDDVVFGIRKVEPVFRAVDRSTKLPSNGETTTMHLTTSRVIVPPRSAAADLVNLTPLILSSPSFAGDPGDPTLVVLGLSASRTTDGLGVQRPNRLLCVARSSLQLAGTRKKCHGAA
jgi:hypothetical protein